MSKIHESGHLRNVRNFEELIGFCKGYGAAYNPGTANIQMPVLDMKLMAYNNTILDVENAVNAFNIATNDRAIKFDALRPFSTKLINLLIASGAHKKTVDDAKGYIRKIRGQRASEKTPKITDATTGSVTEEQNQISASQQSYDQLTGHFSKLVTLLSTEPTYMPNEPEFTIVGLRAHLDELRAANSNVINAYIDVSISRNNRNKSFYIDADCLYDVAMAVKKYMKAVLGTTHVDYKKISGISFKRSF